MIKGNTIGDGVVFEWGIDGATYGGVGIMGIRMAWQWDWVEVPQSTGGGGSTASKNDGILKRDSDVVCSEDGGATMFTELSNRKQGMRLEGRKNAGMPGAGWETWNGHT
jgi:hypothetical protein